MRIKVSPRIVYYNIKSYDSVHRSKGGCSPSRVVEFHPFKTLSNLLLNAFINVKIIFIDKVPFRKFRLYNLSGLASIIFKTYVDCKVNKM